MTIPSTQLLRIVVIGILDLLVSPQTQAQSLLQGNNVVNDYEAEASLRLIDFVDSESTFPSKYAVRSSFRYTFVNDEKVGELNGYQVLVVDTTQNRWRILQAGNEGNDSFQNEAFYNDNELVEQLSTQWTSKATWARHKSIDGSPEKRFHYFNPRFAWWTEPNMLNYSLAMVPGEMFGDCDCFASRLELDSKIVTGLFAKQKCRDVNRVTEISLDANALPIFAILQPALEGNFDMAALKREIKVAQITCTSENRWIAYDDLGRPLIQQTIVDMGEPSSQARVKIENQWLLADGVPDQYLGDPRKDTTPSLDSLSFRRKKPQNQK